MISLDPAARQSCEQYYIDSYDQVFPASFYDYFHDFVASINEISAVNPAHSVLSKSGASVSGTSAPQIGSNTTISASAPETDTQLPLPTNADEIINRIWTEFEQIERRLDPQGMRQSSLEEHPHIVMTSSDVSETFEYPFETESLMFAGPYSLSSLSCCRFLCQVQARAFNPLKCRR